MIDDVMKFPASLVKILYLKLVKACTGKAKEEVLAYGPWGISQYFSSNYIYAYIFGVALTYLARKFNKGMFTNLARRYTRHNRWVKKNSKSWFVRSLLGTRDSQVKALKLMTAQIPVNSENPAAQHFIEDLAKELLHTTTTQTTASTHGTDNESLPEKKDEEEGTPFKTDVDENESQSRKTSDVGLDTILEDSETPNVMPNYSTTAEETSLSLDTSYSATPELFTRSVVREIVDSDDNEQDVYERIQRHLQSSSIDTTPEPELFTREVVREIIDTDDSEDEVYEKIQAELKNTRRRRKPRWKQPKRLGVSRTRSGRAYKY